MLKPTVQVHNINGVLVAEFWDCLRLDPAPVIELRQKYETHVRDKGRPELVIDMLGVEFAGSAALGHFVSLHRSARQRGGRLLFCNVSPTVSEVFRISKLDTLFSFPIDRAAALAMVEKSPPSPPAGPSSSPRNPPLDPPSNGSPESRGPTGGPRRSESNNLLGNGLLRATRRKKLS